ncbi:phosphonoacetaldehyde reductase [Halomonas sp. BC1]|uniref:phosphonoacetaldehyde reductase n=1 Tax=Halomonas sp. BC1 TaxID=1670448 RepID=UPI0009BE9C31|nr:phosphonoacetaldehyde reductase [Halomonas sp. BC1]
MSEWRYHNPVRLEATVLESLPKLMQTLDAATGKWLLVTSAGMTLRGVTERVKALTSTLDIDWLVHDTVTPNPELDDLDAVTARLLPDKIVGVVALGGGSVLDAAKVLAVTLPHGEVNSLKASLREGKGQQWQTKLPSIAVPTTSGTGAEVTPFATVWDQTEHKKYSVTGTLVLPDIALLDPTLTHSLPETETLNTGLDAISHACESLWNVNKTPVSEAYARQALILAKTALPKVLTTPSDIEARAAMQQASVLAGLAISQTRTAIAHAISYPLTSHFDVPHGLACSFTLPKIIDDFIFVCKEQALIDLMRSVQRMLEELSLYSRVHEYASEEKILQLAGEMFHPERAGNYLGKLSSDKVTGFVKL